MSELLKNMCLQLVWSVKKISFITKCEVSLHLMYNWCFSTYIFSNDLNRKGQSVELIFGCFHCCQFNRLRVIFLLKSSEESVRVPPSPNLGKSIKLCVLGRPGNKVSRVPGNMPFFFRPTKQEVCAISNASARSRSPDSLKTSRRFIQIHWNNQTVQRCTIDMRLYWYYS